jgi:uncharacterized protein (TIGR02147 family)
MSIGIDIFEFNDYKVFMKAWLKHRPNGGRGEKSRLAGAIGCNSTYISHVLNGSADLSLEQAIGVSHYMGHNESESHYFYLLVSHARAGTTALKGFLRKDIEKLLSERRNLKARLKAEGNVSEQAKTRFYSRWYYLAIVISLAVEKLRTPEALAASLGLDLNVILAALDFLNSVGIIQKEPNGFYTAGRAPFHLERESPMIAKHHANWRLRALEAIDSAAAEGHEDEVHYSSVISIALKDQAKIQEILIRAIEEVRSAVRSSEPEEAVFSYGIDFFRVTQRVR